MLNKHMATLDFNSHDIKEIVICPNCHGFGYKMRDVTVDYNENKRKETQINCLRCNGGGRLIKRTTVSYESYYQS